MSDCCSDCEHDSSETRRGTVMKFGHHPSLHLKGFPGPWTKNLHSLEKEVT